MLVPPNRGIATNIGYETVENFKNDFLLVEGAFAEDRKTPLEPFGQPHISNSGSTSSVLCEGCFVSALASL